MKISYYQYQLDPVVELNAVTNQKPRRGILIQVEWPGAVIGYADLHPWPEFGDGPLDEQLSDLRKGKISFQLEQSIWLAKRDALARKADVSLWELAPRLKNNFLITDVSKATDDVLDRAKQGGFSTIKMKAGRDFDQDMEFATKVLKSANFMLRIDFNCLAQWQYYEKYMSSLEKSLRARIDYVEDPFPYEFEIYKEARAFSRVAVDRDFSKINFDERNAPPVDQLILKPAHQDVDKFMVQAKKWMIPVTVTSYMDHPVGMVHAALVAADLKKKHDTLIGTIGCMHHHLYHKDIFQTAMTIAGPYIQRVGGKGIGFDFFFHQITWSQVRMS